MAASDRLVHHSLHQHSSYGYSDWNTSLTLDAAAPLFHPLSPSWAGEDPSPIFANLRRSPILRSLSYEGQAEL